MRRDLRGAHPLLAWLDHVDMTWANVVDMWIADPTQPKRHYLEHYFIDFGKALGVMEVTTTRPPQRDGVLDRHP